MKDTVAGLFLILICMAAIQAGLRFGHDQHAMLALVPIGAGCGMAGAFLLAGGMRR